MLCDHRLSIIHAKFHRFLATRGNYGILSIVHTIDIYKCEYNGVDEGPEVGGLSHPTRISGQYEEAADKRLTTYHIRHHGCWFRGALHTQEPHSSKHLCNQAEQGTDCHKWRYAVGSLLFSTLDTVRFSQGLGPILLLYTKQVIVIRAYY
jgi:hypothetical protein